MTYVSIFTRQIDRTFQTASAVWKGAPTTAGSGLTKMKYFVNLLGTYRPSGSTLGDLQTLAEMSDDDGTTSNTGTYGDYIITFTRIGTDDVPTKLVAKLDNCTSANIDTAITNFFSTMTGSNTDYLKYVITAVNIFIH